jgi:hypothetical protein
VSPRQFWFLVSGTCFYMPVIGLAFVHGFWPVRRVVFGDRALGWPLFLTASNSMVPELVRVLLRPEGYSLVV